MYDAELLTQAEAFQQIVSEVRNIRKENQIPNRDQLELSVQLGEGYPAAFESAIIKLSNVDGVARVEDKVPNAFGFIVGTSSFFIPFGDQVDVEAEKAKIQRKWTTSTVS